MQKILKISALIIPLVLSSCNEEVLSENLFQNANIHYGLTVQSVQQISDDVQDAIKIWNESFGDGFLITEAGKFPAYINIIDNNELDADGLTYRFQTHCLINLKQKQNGYSYSNLIVHEIGHCIGVDHSNNIQSIMFPFILDGQRITEQLVDLLNNSQQR